MNVPLKELERHLSELNPSQEVVAYCRGPYCVLSYEAVEALRGRGFKARRLQDGFPEWRAAGLPVAGGTFDCAWGTLMEIQSALCCPRCGHVSTEEMPLNACVYFYDCKGCGVRLKPKPGDCCVFCSYGSVACPPMQENLQCCSK